MSARFVGVRIGTTRREARLAERAYGTARVGEAPTTLVVAASPVRTWGAVIEDTDALPPRIAAGSADHHLRVDVDCPVSGRWSGLADVLVATAAPTRECARRRTAALRSAHPGCLVTVVPMLGRGACLLGTGDVRCVEATVVTGAAGTPSALWPMLGSFLHAWLSAGRGLEDLLRMTLFVRGPHGTYVVTAR
ncbi:hypothetical protein [Streptomyces avicenniae]|uniref:hypothetical protein n=1 Tax=Streptomyces avicenniae TaxID=500153 RepID=UPI00069948ED|nr:hypothetical protein [Streptomyces avicenniae]